ncbi:hypothetical protein [uncultured Phascolarctobacterium sp.]|uniref:hypothetical protein n=1 Tax=uncultured Phascolarctobacterium sp. TaxID=512296 RepID=UPI0025E3E616|nr:hypothetical protein [uncultured Phascolarctobacterium sp.]
MVLGIALLTVIADIFILIQYKSAYIKQQIYLLLIFIIGLTFVGQLDVLLPIYFTFSAVTLISKLKFVTKVTFFSSIYFLIYLLYGLINQDIVATIVAFVAKFWQFIIFFIVISIKIKFKETITMQTIYTCLIIETLLGMYLLSTGQMMDPNGMVRLVSNSQPITGNLAIVTLPISVYLYFSVNATSVIRRKLILTNLLFLVWIVLSGTRGYLMIYSFTMLVILLDYFGFRVRDIKSLIKNSLFILCGISLVVLLIIIWLPDVTDRVDSILRLSASVGIRTFENALIIDFFKNTSLLVNIFGIGMGGKAGEYSEYLKALNDQLTLGMWHSSRYMYGSGVLFHNLYANILLTLGILGLIVIAFMGLYIYKTISLCCIDSVDIKYALILYFIGFLLMNYYRWSADCGIGEMIILALILQKIKQDKNEDER